MLPVRLQRQSDPLPRRRFSVCTYDISEHGARVTGLQEPLESGEIVILEREAQWIDAAVATGAHGVGAVLGKHFAHRFGDLGGRLFFQGRNAGSSFISGSR